jgi:hypothetical protein
MDPISILSVVGSSLSITKVTISGVQQLSQLKERYDNVPLRVSGVITKLQLISFSLSTLDSWAKARQGSNTENLDLVVQLEASIKSCESVISCIHVKVSGAIAKENTWERVKHVWNENTIRNFENDLDHQINALQLLLHTAQLYVDKSRQNQADTDNFPLKYKRNITAAED